MKIETGKLYRTRFGEKARIYATDGGGSYPVHGAIWNEKKKCWSPQKWDAAGVSPLVVRGDAPYAACDLMSEWS